MMFCHKMPVKKFQNCTLLNNLCIFIFYPLWSWRWWGRDNLHDIRHTKHLCCWNVDCDLDLSLLHKYNERLKTWLKRCTLVLRNFFISIILWQTSSVSIYYQTLSEKFGFLEHQFKQLIAFSQLVLDFISYCTYFPLFLHC